MATLCQNRHWFTIYRSPGSRAPWCVRCKKPNPKWPNGACVEALDFEFCGEPEEHHGDGMALHAYKAPPWDANASGRACEDCEEDIPKGERRTRCECCSLLVCGYCRNHFHNRFVQGATA